MIPIRQRRRAASNYTATNDKEKRFIFNEFRSYIRTSFDVFFLNAYNNAPSVTSLSVKEKIFLISVLEFIMLCDYMP